MWTTHLFSNLEKKLFTAFVNNVILYDGQLFLIHPPISMMSPLATIMTLKLVSTMTQTHM